MSNPIVCNRAPAPLSTGHHLAPVRFSLRSNTTQIVLANTNLYLGYGGAFYEPTVLPEDIGVPGFDLDVLLGNPDGQVTRQIVPGWLRIEKSGVPSDNLRGTYFFGRLDAPMPPDGPLMLEFRLKLNDVDITPAAVGDQFTGIVFGVFIKDSGFMIRFYRDNLSNRWIEVFDANENSIQRVNWPALTYRYDFDWDGADVTYKALWDPRADRMWLLLSSGQDSLVEDTIMVAGQVSDFPLVPVDQIRPHQPIAFFGHAYPGTNSVSYWGGAYLHNETSIGMLDGLYQGGHDGFIRNSHVVTLDTSQKPRDNGQAWVVLPDSYGLIGGDEKVVANELVLSRTDLTRSFGFYRVEPSVVAGSTIVDFSVRGSILERSSSADQVSGFEVFVDTGSIAARVGFVDNLVNRLVGILGSGPSSLSGSYSGELLDWAQSSELRLVLEPAVSARLYRLGIGETGLAYFLMGEVLLANLPASSLPNPSVGFLHNALSCSVRSDMTVSNLRYMAGAILYEAATGLPTGPWTKIGTGPTTIQDDVLVLQDDSFTALTRYRTTEATLDVSDGMAVDFFMKILQYQDSTGPDPIRQNTGVAVVLDNGSYRAALMFADGGPELGKIAYLASATTYEESLFRIRADDPDVAGSYCSVDWTEFHLYRLEWDSNRAVRLFVDNSKVASIDLLSGAFPFPLTEDGQPKVAFGSVLDALQNTSYWRHVARSISDGYDLSIAQRLNVVEQDDRFGKAANIIVSADI